MDYYMAQLAQEGEGEDISQTAAQLRAYYGLDQPFCVQYFNHIVIKVILSKMQLILSK